MNWRFIRVVAAFSTAVMIAAYLVASFVELTFNVTMWPKDTRALLAFIAFATLLLISIAAAPSPGKHR